MKKLFGSAKDLHGQSQSPPPPEHSRQHSSSGGGTSEVLRRRSGMNHQRQMSAQLIRDNSNDNRKSPMIAGEPLHDYKRAVELLKSNKFLAEGFLMKKTEVAPDGKQHPANPESQWAKWFVQLSGCIMSVWNAADMEQAAKENRTVPPQYLNLSDAFVHPFPPNPRAPPTPTPFQFALNTAGLNRLLFCAPNLQSLTMWINAIRLACWERSRCNEIYTGVLLYSKQPSTGWPGLAMMQNELEGWIRCRLPGDTEWRRVYLTVVRGKSSNASMTSNTNKKSKRSSFLGFGGGAGNSSSKRDSASEAVIEDLPGGGQLSTIAFWHDKPSKKDVPLCIAQHIYYVSAVYPEVDALVETSSMFKLEGTFLNPADGYKYGWGVGGRAEKQGFALVMLEKGGQHEMLEWIVALSDAFRLYGRPQGFSFDPRDPNSLYFALPIGPHRDRMFLDRELIDHLDINESRPRAIRAIFHNILFDRMQGRRPLNMPPVDTNRTAADSPGDYSPVSQRQREFGADQQQPSRSPVDMQNPPGSSPNYQRQNSFQAPILPPIGESDSNQRLDETAAGVPAIHNDELEPPNQRRADADDVLSNYTTASEHRANNSSPGHAFVSAVGPHGQQQQDFRHSSSPFSQSPNLSESNRRPLPSPGNTSVTNTPVIAHDGASTHSRPSSQINAPFVNAHQSGSSRGASPVPPPANQMRQTDANPGLLAPTARPFTQPAGRSPGLEDDRLGYLSDRPAAGSSQHSHDIIGAPPVAPPPGQTPIYARNASPRASSPVGPVSPQEERNIFVGSAAAASAIGAASIGAAALRPSSPTETNASRASHEVNQPPQSAKAPQVVPSQPQANAPDDRVALSQETPPPKRPTLSANTSGVSNTGIGKKPSPKDLNNSYFLSEEDTNIHSDLMAALNFVDRSDSPPPSSVNFAASSTEASPVNQRVIQQQSLRNSVGPPPRSFTPTQPSAIAAAAVAARYEQPMEKLASTPQNVAAQQSAPSSFGAYQKADERAKLAEEAAQARREALSKPGRAGVVPGVTNARRPSGWADEEDYSDDDIKRPGSHTTSTAPTSYSGTGSAAPIQSTATAASQTSNGPPVPAKAVPTAAPTAPAAPAVQRTPTVDPQVEAQSLIQAGMAQQQAKSAKAIEQRSRETGTPLVSLEPRAPSPKQGLVASIPPPKPQTSAPQQPAAVSAPVQTRSASNQSQAAAEAPVAAAASIGQSPSPVSQFGGTFGGYNPMMMGSMGYGSMPPWGVPMMGGPGGAAPGGGFGGFGAPMMSPGGMYGSTTPSMASPTGEVPGSQLGHSSRNSVDAMALHMQQQQAAMMAAQQAYMVAMQQFMQHQQQQSPPTSPTHGQTPSSPTQAPTSMPPGMGFGFPAYTGFNMPMYGGGMFGAPPVVPMQQQQPQQQQHEQHQHPQEGADSAKKE